MEALEAMMKKHNIDIDSSYFSSHGHTLSASGFSFNATSTASSDEWFIDSTTSYHMDKDKAIFSTINESSTKKIFVGDDRSISVIGSGTIQVDNVHVNVYCVFQVFPATFYRYIKSLIQVRERPYSFHLTKL
jgi:hypothetical protein